MESFDELQVQESLKIEMKASLGEIQRNAIFITCPVVVIAGLILIASSASFPDPLQGTSSGLSLILVGFLSLYTMQFRRFIANIILTCGMMAVLVSLAIWLDSPSLLLLTGFLVSFVAITTNPEIGIGSAFILTAGILALGKYIDMSAQIKGLLILQVWVSFGITLLTFVPLVDALRTAWLSQTSARSLLIQARDYQRELKQSLSDLEDSNKQLTRLNQLTQVLYQTAEEARLAKQQFVANVSHELRTPLNMILGFGEMIIKNPYGKKLPPALMADLGVIVRNSEHLSSLIDDVLDMSQLEAGQMTINREDVSLRDIADSATAVVKPLFESKNLSLEVDVSEHPMVFCDRTRIREVLINLLSNAGRFTQQGFVRVCGKQEGNFFIVSVKDSGPGIPKKEQNKLFQPFQQVDASLRRRYSGTGLGLSISKGLVELHGGKIWLESEEGSGSTFYFSLPIMPPVPLEGGPARWLYHDIMYKERTELSKTPVVQVQPRYVIVDHSDTLQRIMKRYYNDIELVQVNTIAEAVEAIRETPARALLVKSASIADAVERCKETRNLPFGFPAIICTLPDILTEPRLHNISNYLVKPVRSEKLTALLEEFNLPHRSILIVDDESEVLQLFKRILLSANRGYRVITAYDGKQALSIIHEDPPDLILLDLIMPEMSGFEFLAAREQDERIRQIPVIILSAQDPLSQPLTSEVMLLTRPGGLHIPQMLAVLEAISQDAAPQGSKVGRGFPEAQPG